MNNNCIKSPSNPLTTNRYLFSEMQKPKREREQNKIVFLKLTLLWLFLLIAPKSFECFRNFSGSKVCEGLKN